jgi:hypothetical protein
MSANLLGRVKRLARDQPRRVSPAECIRSQEGGYVTALVVVDTDGKPLAGGQGPADALPCKRCGGVHVLVEQLLVVEVMVGDAKNHPGKPTADQLLTPEELARWRADCRLPPENTVILPREGRGS